MVAGDAVVLTAEGRKRFGDIGARVGRVAFLDGPVVVTTWQGLAWQVRFQIKLGLVERA